MSTLTVRKPPTGVPVATVPLPGDAGDEVAQYVITYAPPVRDGAPHRYLVWLTLLSDGCVLDSNAPCPCAVRPTRENAIECAEYLGEML